MRKRILSLLVLAIMLIGTAGAEMYGIGNREEQALSLTEVQYKLSDEVTFNGTENSKATKEPAATDEPARWSRPYKIVIKGSHYVAKGKKIKLETAVSPASATQKMKWKSSNPRIATVSSKGQVTGLRSGKVKITATSAVNPRIKKTWKITVKAKAVSGVKITAATTKINLYEKDTVKLKVKASPSSAAQVFSFSSNNEDIAIVSEDGTVYFYDTGKVVITATAMDGSRKKGKITFTVIEEEEEQPTKAPTQEPTPESSANPTATPKATFTPEPTTKPTPEPSEKPAATPKATFAPEPTIKPTPESSTKPSAAPKPTFTPGPTIKPTAEPTIKPVETPPTEPTEIPTVQPTATPTPEIPETSIQYRALLIGEKTFLTTEFSYETWQYEYSTDTANRNVGDAQNMATMLSRVKGPQGGKYTSTRKTDLTYDGVRNAIQNTFKDTTGDDVSLFFIASHGDSDGDGDLIVAFTGDPKSRNDREKYWDHNCIPFSTLASWLKEYVKGKVIVIIEACGAGSAIYDPEEENSVNGPAVKNLTAAEKDAAAARIAKQAARAFANADSRVNESNSTGDLRNSKFYVLACSRHHEVSWGTEYGPWNYFTKWLIDGVGKIGSSPADKRGNSDGYVTLTELFDYISYVGDDYAFDPGDGYMYYQHVQRYPVGSAYELFCVK